MWRKYWRLGIVVALGCTSPVDPDQEGPNVAVSGAVGTLDGYQVLDIAPAGAYMSGANAINDQGLVAGNYWTSAGGAFSHRVFLWSRTGGWEDLGSVAGAEYAYPTALNHAGLMSLTASIGGVPRAFRWSRAEGFAELGTLGGGSQATDVNDAGEITGQSEMSAGIWQPFIWRPGKGMSTLGSTGGSWGSGAAINARSMIVGSSASGGFYWTPNRGMQPLASLGVPGGNFGIDINNSGTITGQYNLGDGYTHGFLLKPNGELTDFGFVGGGMSMFPWRMSSRGHVVGFGLAADWSWIYWVFYRNQLTIVQAPGGAPMGINDINHCGNIAGSFDPDGISHAAVWVRRCGN